jgi:hypothetical protein
MIFYIMYLNDNPMSKLGIVVSNLMFLLMITFNLLVRGNFIVGLKGPKVKEPKGIIYDKLPKSLVTTLDILLFILIIASVQFFSHNYGSFK